MAADSIALDIPASTARHRIALLSALLIVAVSMEGLYWYGSTLETAWDVVLPDSYSGRELAEIAKDRQPRVKILLMSGYAPDVLASGAKSAAPIADLIHKPFRKIELARRVRSLLDS